MSAERAAVRQLLAVTPERDELADLHADRESIDAAADDASLAARAVTDRMAFGLLYDRYAERVYRYCYRRLGDREAAEDATSQVFLKALTGLADYRERGTFAGWLFAIAFSTTVDLQRRRRPTEPLDEAEFVAAAETGPEETAITTEQTDRLWSLIGDLPADQRRALELRLAGLSGAEVAQAMGRTLRSIKMLQFRAIQRLRLRLGVGTTPDSDHDR